MQTPAGIENHHLNRLAVVYVRQAVVDRGPLCRANRVLQWAQREYARRWGWPQETIRTVVDLGRSGSTFQGREGMQTILDWIAWCRVGLLLASDISRLTRSGADYARLVKMCRDTETLLAVNGILVETQDITPEDCLSQVVADVITDWVDME